MTLVWLVSPHGHSHDDDEEDCRDEEIMINNNIAILRGMNEDVDDLLTSLTVLMTVMAMFGRVR